MIYNMDLDAVLTLLKKVSVEHGAKASNEFYFTCLDKLDLLITERNSTVTPKDVVRILRTLSYFRPRDYDRMDRHRKDIGRFTKSEIQDDIISVRHRDLIKKNSGKSESLGLNIFYFYYENVPVGLFKDMFTQYDDEQESKLGKSLYDVMGLYI